MRPSYSLPAASLTFVLALFVYSLTVAPDLTWANWGTDGGELITAAVTLGVPHPPGYPTYVLLGKVFSYLPLGHVAYRFNLFSAVCVSLAAALVTATAYARSGHHDLGSSLAAGLSLPFAPVVWGQAVITEVYGLNLALVAALLWALLGQRPSLLVGLLFGLSLTTHLTSILLLPLILALSPRSQWRHLAIGLPLGLLPLLALPLLASSGSPVVWGQPATWRGWWWLISGALYRYNLFTADWSSRLLPWSIILLSQFTWLGLPFILIGLIKPRAIRSPFLLCTSNRMFDVRKSFSDYKFSFSVVRLGACCLLRKSGIPARWPRQGCPGHKFSFSLGCRCPCCLLCITALLYFFYALTYNTHDAIILLLPAILLLSLILAEGMRHVNYGGLFLPLALLLLNFSQQNLREEQAIRPLAVQQLQAAPTDAILLMSGEGSLFTMWYLQHVEGQRPDLILIDKHLFAFDWYRLQLQQRYPQVAWPSSYDLTALTDQRQRPLCTIDPWPSLRCPSPAFDT